jgi:hypothetical protein
MARFYGHFAAAYGTIWFCLMLAAVLTHSHINAGPFGLWGFPVIALIYALLRSSVPDSQQAEIEALRERVRWLESRLPDWTEE